MYRFCENMTFQNVISSIKNTSFSRSLKEVRQTNPALTIHVSTFVASSLLSFLRWNTFSNFNVLFHKYEQILTRLMKEAVERPVHSENVQDFSASQTGLVFPSGRSEECLRVDYRQSFTSYVKHPETFCRILQLNSFVVLLDVNRMYVLLNVGTKCYFCMIWNAVSV